MLAYYLLFYIYREFLQVGGFFARAVRKQSRAGDWYFSVWQVAHRNQIEPAYLSKIEREVQDGDY